MRAAGPARWGSAAPGKPSALARIGASARERVFWLRELDASAAVRGAVDGGDPPRRRLVDERLAGAGAGRSGSRAAPGRSGARSSDRLVAAGAELPKPMPRDQTACKRAKAEACPSGVYRA